MLICKICNVSFERLTLKGNVPQTCSQKCLKQRNKLNKELRALKNPEKAIAQKAAAVIRTKHWRIKTYSVKKARVILNNNEIDLQLFKSKEDLNNARINFTYAYFERLRRSYHKRKYESFENYVASTKEEYLFERDRVLFKRKLKEEGYYTFYSIVTKQPIKLKEPLNRPFIKIKRIIIKCTVCKKDDTEVKFKTRSNGKYLKSECIACNNKGAIERSKINVRELRDTYLKQQLKLKGIIVESKFLNVYKALIQAKRSIKDYHEEI
jgi:hypothetical protein